MAGPFKMKSGNSPLFKQMGSSPLTKSYKQSYNEKDSKVNKKKYDTYEKYEKAAKAYNKDKYGTTEPTKVAKGADTDKKGLAKNEADKQANYKRVAQKNKETRVIENADEQVAKSQKDVKAIVKEVANTVTKKDLKKDKKAELKGKTMREKQAIRKKYKDAKKTLKTLKKT